MPKYQGKFGRGKRESLGIAKRERESLGGLGRVRGGGGEGEGSVPPGWGGGVGVLFPFSPSVELRAPSLLRRRSLAQTNARWS